MIKIAVCDDEKIMLTEVKTRLSEKNLACDGYSDEQDLLKRFMRDRFCYDLVILDMELLHQTGITVAYEIRKMNTKVIIIFLTAFEQYAIDSFACSPLRYLTKPIQEIKFNEAIDAALAQYNRENQELLFENKGTLLKIKAADIVYLEGTRTHAVKIYQNEQQEPICVSKTLKQAETQLDTGCFMRIHHSFIINTQYITAIQSEHVFLGEKKLPVSRQYKKSLLQYYTNDGIVFRVRE